jgi:hypothetical protein
MKDHPTPPPAPGTLTSLLEEVFRGSAPEQAAWVEGLAPGTTLGRYDLIREIGRGGSAVVWEARDRELGRRVAVKVIRRHAKGRPEQRLLAEAEVAARLSHPGIVTTLDVGRNEKGAWLVQEFLAGRTLAERLAEGPLPLRDAVKIALRVASALAYAHAHGVVHRDLTPSNVFLCEDGQVKLLDLGMAQAFGRRKLEGGTPDWMAPEQARGEPEDERVDVFALGVLLHRMLTGESPFPRGAAPDRRQAARLETPDLPGLPDLVDRMLSPAPLDRPRDAAEVEQELEALAGTWTGSRTTTGSGRVRTRRRWPRWAFAVLAVAVAAGAWLAGRAGQGPAVVPHGTFAFGASGTSPNCRWGTPTWIELDRVPADAIMRNGEVGGQEVAEVAGRKAWKFTSDWAQLLLPLGVAEKGDPFAVEAQFYMPPITGFMRGADLVVFTEPVGGTRKGNVAGGIRFGVRAEPGKAPYFEWYGPREEEPQTFEYVGTVAEDVTGKWHTLRIEGSRSAKWYRGLLDGRPIVVAHGDYDLRGTRAVLGSGYAYFEPLDVAWSNYRTFAGTSECR